MIDLPSTAGADIALLYRHFGNKPFMAHQAQGFPIYPLLNAFGLEEKSFKKTVLVVSSSKFPTDANVISSHTIYMVRVGDDESLKTKARIAPHGKKDSIKDKMRSDGVMCAPSGVLILLIFATLLKVAHLKCRC